MKDERAFRKELEETLQLNNNTETEPFRQQFHLTPPKGLLNDPNGLIQWRGIYHVFFQWMPFKTGHGSKWWGHATTKDWVNWELLPPALAPVQDFEKNGCYSGSAVVRDGLLQLFYTGNVKDEYGNRSSYQCLAVSEDGVHFEKLGPVISQPERYTAHFRDPKVWYEAGSWWLVIGAQRDDKEGHVLIYRSRDLRKWEFLGPLAGKGVTLSESFGFMWECPDFFELDGMRVLLVSPQGLEKESYQYQNQYQTGVFTGSFDSENATFSHGSFQEMDKGFEFYAPQTFEDEHGRRLLLGWMGVPDQQEDMHPTIKDGWVHCLTMPRELLHLQNGKIAQQPLKEWKQLRGAQQSKDIHVTAETVEWTEWKAIVAEINIEVEEGKSWTISWRDYLTMSFDAEYGVFTLERPDLISGEPAFRTSRIEEIHSLRCYFDRSSAEIFINDGEHVATSRLFPRKQEAKLRCKTHESIMFQVDAWELHSFQWSG
ncbi:glycoside hydrolase family 32 protein [Salibacterium salarium]|nr:sucrose-6-phosphate hydrolase [Salibacterium salarium]